MWLNRLIGRKTKEVPAMPVDVAQDVAEEAAEKAQPDTHLVDTSAIVHRAQVPPAGPTFAGQPVPFYPNREEALPAAPPEILLQTQQMLVEKLHQASGFSYSDFNNYLRPVLQNYAQFVHLLPASENHHHWDIGGLLRHGFNRGLYWAVARGML